MIKSIVIEKSLRKVGFSNFAIHEIDVLIDLPIVYKKRFKLYQYVDELTDNNFVVAAVLDDTIDINDIVLHIDFLQIKMKSKVVVCFIELSGFYKKQFIVGRIPFIAIKSNEVFLPFLGLYLTSQKKSSEHFYRKPFTASEQIVFLAMVYNLTMSNDISPSVLVNETSLSQPTVYRSLERFSEDKVFLSDTGSSYNNWDFAMKAGELWESYRILLTSPISRKIYIDETTFQQQFNDVKLYRSGITALSYYTNIQESNSKTYAITKRDYKIINAKIANVILHKTNHRSASFSKNVIELEIWKYEPYSNVRNISMI